MINVNARKCTSLNGKWQVIIDPTGIGNWRQVWKEKKPVNKTDFVEYSFKGSPMLNVPGDFNTQLCELKYMEGTVWYKKTFNYDKSDKRLFIHFGAVNYIADVYLNGSHIGSHERGFTPFQFEITDSVKNGGNTLVVKVNNQRLKNGLPALGYDWFNYGGITRDVNLVETNRTYIEDYFIQLKNYSDSEVSGWIHINGDQLSQKIKIEIPELNLEYNTVTDEKGFATIYFNSNFNLWSPEDPKLYRVIVNCETDTKLDEIGFRNIAIKDSKIVLNSKPIFIKGVNIHEENPLKATRAFSKYDALLLLNWAKELGCNFGRLGTLST